MKLLQYFADAAVKIDTNTINIPKDNANDVLAGVLNGVYFTAGAVAVVVIILAGYSFTTSVYDPAKITQAKNALLYAVVGLIVIVIAFFVTQFIMGGFK